MLMVHAPSASLQALVRFMSFIFEDYPMTSVIFKAIMFALSFSFGVVIAAAIGLFAVVGLPLRDLYNALRFIGRVVARAYHWARAPYVAVLRITNRSSSFDNNRQV